MSVAVVAKPETPADIAAEMKAIGRAAREAARVLAITSTKDKNAALSAMAAAIRGNADAILAENALDLADAAGQKLAASFVDRLTLTPERVEAMAKGIEEVAALPDPVGTVLAAWDRPNGLRIERVRTPLGVVA
ncbi:MAG TPA: gamma-glutamyl-phosphate reductase, partial [Bauldia sp.]|nr:gamma-glutamyl-phosphate reductase [Bauldia sp.]